MKHIFTFGEHLRVHILIHSLVNVSGVHVGVVFHRDDGVISMGLSNNFSLNGKYRKTRTLMNVETDSTYELVLDIPSIPLGNSNYSIGMTISEHEYIASKVDCFFQRDNLASFSVVSADHDYTYKHASEAPSFWSMRVVS